MRHLSLQTVSALRTFNRFYLPTMELLDDHYLGSEFSVPEGRVLYEVYHARGCSAAALAKTLRLDKSYLSRILRRHEKNGLLRRVVSQRDARVHELYLTEEGVRRTEALIARIDDRLASFLAPLSKEDCTALERALGEATAILRNCGEGGAGK